MMNATITKLAEKAMLVKLNTGKAGLTRRDVEAEEMIQQQLDDASLTVNSKLFRDPGNPVNQIVTAAGRVYQYHKLHTHPYIDRGPRILPNALYMEYCEGIRELTNGVENLMAEHMPHYDEYVQQDIAWRSRQAQLSGKEARAKVEDYPTAEQFKAKLTLDFRFMPLPDARHFLFDISEEDEQKFNADMAEVEKFTTNNTVVKMLKPLKHLVDKLQVPIDATDPATGKKLGIFRDSAIDNVIEGVQLAKKLAIDPPEELQDMTKELEEAIGHWAERANWLRESPVNRENAAKQLAHIASQMSAFMGLAA